MDSVLATSPSPQDNSHEVQRLGRFVADARLSDLGGSLPTLKRNVLDSIACALGALDGELIATIRAHAEQFSGRRPPPSSAADAPRSISRRSSMPCWCAIPICWTPI